MNRNGMQLAWAGFAFYTIKPKASRTTLKPILAHKLRRSRLMCHILPSNAASTTHPPLHETSLKTATFNLLRII